MLPGGIQTSAEDRREASFTNQDTAAPYYCYYVGLPLCHLLPSEGPCCRKRMTCLLHAPGLPPGGRVSIKLGPEVGVGGDEPATVQAPRSAAHSLKQQPQASCLTSPSPQFWQAQRKWTVPLF